MVLAVFERIADDALDTFSRIDVFLNGDLIRCALLENSAGIGVNAFRVFADHDKINILRLDAFQRAQGGIEQAHGPHIGVKVHLKAHAEKDFFSVDIGLDPWIAEGSRENSVKVAAKHGKAIGRNCHTVAEIAVGAPVEFAQLNIGASRTDDFESLGDYFLSNAVSGDHGNALPGRILGVHGREVNTSQPR